MRDLAKNTSNTLVPEFHETTKKLKLKKSILSEGSRWQLQSGNMEEQEYENETKRTVS